jgi:hypothetical protein
MDINTGAQLDLGYPVASLGYPAARFNEKGCLQVWGGHVLMLYLFILELNATTAATSHEFECKTHRKRATCRWMLKL